MNFDQIRRYWEERAATDASSQSTTQDVYLREIEARVLGEQVTKLRPRRVLDVGCGDARTTIRLATDHRQSQFSGGDYALSMLKNSAANVAAALGALREPMGPGIHVAVRPKRGEGLGFVGRGEGIASWAVALLERG